MFLKALFQSQVEIHHQPTVSRSSHFVHITNFIHICNLSSGARQFPLSSNSHNFHSCPCMLPENSIQQFHQVSLSVWNSNVSRNIQWSLQMLRQLFVCKEILLKLRTFIRKCYHCVHSVLNVVSQNIQWSPQVLWHLYGMFRTIKVVTMYVCILSTHGAQRHMCKACCLHTL